MAFLIDYIGGAIRSRTVRAGAAVVLASLAAVAVEVWVQLTPDQLSLLDGVFGPATTAIIGIGMIFLRVITTQSLANR